MFDGNSYSAHLDADATKARVAIAEAKSRLIALRDKKQKLPSKLTKALLYLRF